MICGIVPSEIEQKLIHMVANKRNIPLIPGQTTLADVLDDEEVPDNVVPFPKLRAV